MPLKSLLHDNNHHYSQLSFQHSWFNIYFGRKLECLRVICNTSRDNTRWVVLRIREQRRAPVATVAATDDSIMRGCPVAPAIIHPSRSHTRVEYSKYREDEWWEPPPARRVRSGNNQGIKRELKVSAAHLCQAQKGQNHPSPGYRGDRGSEWKGVVRGRVNKRNFLSTPAVFSLFCHYASSPLACDAAWFISLFVRLVLPLK